MDVLIVEDARDQRRLLGKIVHRLGHRVFEAEDGLQALAILTAEPSIQLVVSDWMMPGLDGIGLCQAIRGGQFDRYIYFILLTGKSDRDALVEGLSVGADDFVSKPIDFRELEVRLKSGQRVVELEQTLALKNNQLQDALDRVEQDLASAAQTQESLLAAPAVIHNVGFDWHFKPSKILGGDMFGYHAVDDEHVMFYQLDVAGHGIPSALFSFAINHVLMDVDSPSALVRDTTAEPPAAGVLPPDVVISRLNQRFQTTAERMLYFTICFGVLHGPTGRVSICHGGHPPTLWLRAEDGGIQHLKRGGVPVGMVPNMSWQTEVIQLQPGDRLFLYSDGLTECENSRGEMFGEQRLCQAVQSAGRQPMKTMISQIWNDLCQWRGSDSFDDDMTGLVLEYQGG